MAKNATSKEILAYIFIAFGLLAALFGMNIMSFIFGQLGSADYIADASLSTINETSAYANVTGYTVDAASARSFSGGATLIAAWTVENGVYNISVPLSNLTLSSAGVLTNATATTYSNLSISYNSKYRTDAELAARDVSNESLQGIKTYAEGSTTQFNVVSIVIILVLLVGVFLFFWKTFMKGGSGKKSGGDMGATFG